MATQWLQIKQYFCILKRWEGKKKEGKEKKKRGEGNMPTSGWIRDDYFL